MSPILLYSFMEYPFEASGLQLLLVGLVPLSLRDLFGSDRMDHYVPSIGSRLLFQCVTASCIATGYLQFTSMKAITDPKVAKGTDNELLSDWYAGDEGVETAMSHPVIGPYATQLVYQQASVVWSASSEKISLVVMHPFAQDALEWFPSKNAYELVLMTTTDTSSQEYIEIADRYGRLKALHKH
jgi:hypothetical protein